MFRSTMLLPSFASTTLPAGNASAGTSSASIAHRVRSFFIAVLLSQVNVSAGQHPAVLHDNAGMILRRGESCAIRRDCEVVGKAWGIASTAGCGTATLAGPPVARKRLACPGALAGCAEPPAATVSAGR